MDRRERTAGFSLVELIVVLMVIGIAATMAYSALSRSREVSKETLCLNNLKQIAVALNLYYNDHKAYPPENLSESLEQYVGGDAEVFICPSDFDPQGDSYSRFYVARTDQSSQDYVCACPRHVDEGSTVTLFSSASAQVLEMEPVYWNGQRVEAGTSVGSGVLTFGDRSSVTVPADMMVRLVQSFRLHDGRFYSVIAVDVNETGTLDIEVTPGSRFEVVTPGAIAGVQGTKFKVTTYVDGDDFCTKVEVTEGKVAVKPRWTEEKQRAVKPGQVKRNKLHRAKMCRVLRRLWDRRRVEFNDDWRYEGDSDKFWWESTGSSSDSDGDSEED
ncbi:MAG: FecR domain-containing protein [bacterium]